jgi:hypothetical protein
MAAPKSTATVALAATARRRIEVADLAANVAAMEIRAAFRDVDTPLLVERIWLDPPGPTELLVRLSADRPECRSPARRDMTEVKSIWHPLVILG